MVKCVPNQVNSGARLLRDVRHDLSDVVEICEGRKKQTNYLRSLLSDLAKGTVLILSLYVCVHISFNANSSSVFVVFSHCRSF